MLSKYELLIIYQSDPLDARILEAIHRKDYKVSVYSKAEDIEDNILSIENPIILTYCSEERQQDKFFKNLYKLTNIKRFPIIAVAYNITGLETELSAAFPLCIAVRAPADPQKLMDSIRFIERNYRLKISEDSGSLADQDEQDKNALLSTVFDKADIDDQIEQAKDLFTTINNLNLNNTGVGGEALPEILSGNRKSINIECSLPQNSELSEFCRDFLSGLKPRSRASVARVNKISCRLVAPLKLQTEMEDLTKSASILYSQSFASQDRDLLTQDYAFKGGILLRKQICSKIKDSALNTGSELSNKDLNSIIASVARLIGNEEQAGNSQLSIIASAICMADLINRKCFQDLYWNFRNAQRIVKAIRQGRFKMLHPTINCISLKLLSEALTSSANMKLLGSVRLRENAKLEGSIRISEETLVDLPELEPGMKLSRSLTTESGKPILDPDIILDQDLIMRIWQLSGICPLEKVVVRRSH